MESKVNKPKVKQVTLNQFNVYYGIKVGFDDEFHELFEELDKTDLECHYIAHDWGHMKHVALIIEAVVNIEDKLYFAVRNLDIMNIDFDKDINLKHEG